MLPPPPREFTRIFYHVLSSDQLLAPIFLCTLHTQNAFVYPYHLRAFLKRCLAPILKTYSNNQKVEHSLWILYVLISLDTKNKCV